MDSRSAPRRRRPTAVQHSASRRVQGSSVRPRVYDDGHTRIDEHGVRTVRIRGQATPPRRRTSAAAYTYGANPDRAAMWAVVMGVFMVVVAIATGSSA